MSQIELETEFQKIRLEEGPCQPKDESGGVKCECKKIIVKPLEQHSTTLKVKDKKRNIIKPSRLKIIGTAWNRKSRNKNEVNDTETVSEDLDTFTSEAFLKMRITPKEVLTHSPSPTDEKDEKVSPASQSCSAQAKLQQQFSSSEFDSTIEEMSEVLAYHLNLNLSDKNFLVDSMYT